MKEFNLTDLVVLVKEKSDSGLFQEALELLEGSSLGYSSPLTGLWMQWAVALYHAGRLDEAKEAFGKLADDSYSKGPLASRNLAAIQFGAGDYESCLATLAPYRLLRPHEPRGLRLWFDSLMRLERSHEAIPELESGRNIFPANREMLQMLAEARFASGDWLKLLCLAGEGERRFGRSREMATMLLVAFSELGLLQAAAKFVPEILGNLDQDCYLPLTVLGNYFYQVQDYASSIHCFELATQCQGEAGLEECNRGFALLAAGRFDLGWQAYFRRKQYFDLSDVPDIPGVPTWQGEDLAGKKVLVHWEQGFGDSIQFMRFLPEFCEIAGSVIFNAQPQIIKLLQDNRREIDFDAAKKQVFGVDVQIHLTDLPLILGLDSPDKLPTRFPYLTAERGRVEIWRKRLQGCPGFKVGIVWAGSPKHARDHDRSACLADLLPLATVPGISWISLQIGGAVQEISHLPEYWNILDLSGEINDYADTAAVIENLDLVISVDTSVAHLAGALNKPVWILLPGTWVDWRWELETERTPWYPSARLFRQEKGGTWQGLASGMLRDQLWRHVTDQSEIAPAIKEAIDCFLKGGLCSDAWVDHLAGDDISWALPLAAEALVKQGFKEGLAALAKHFEGNEKWFLPLAAKCLAAGGAQYAQVIEKAFAEGKLRPLDLLAWADWLLSKGVAEKAIDILKKGVANWPDDPRLFTGLARCYQRTQGGEPEALKWYERALAKFPKSATATLEYAGMLQQLNRAQEAMEYLSKAIRLSPGAPQPWNVLATHLRHIGLSQISTYILEALLPIHDNPVQRCALAESLAGQGGDDLALEMLRNVNLHGAGIELRIRYAVALRASGSMSQYDAALAQLDAEGGDAPEVRYMVGWRKLQIGDFDAGWPRFCAGLARKKKIFPEWQGEPIEGKHILVYQDHGYGDLIQFLPLIHELAARCRKVTLALVEGCMDIVEYQRLPARIIAVKDMDWAGGDCDFQVSQMRLPFFLKTNLLQHNHSSPFLRAPTDRLPAWRKKIEAERAFKIGIIWAGNPQYVNDWYRSTELSDWECLTEFEGVAWYSFQKDVASNQALGMPGFNLHNVAGDCKTWLDTASMMQLMDIVISVDSGGAHVAAGLGKPTWILLPPVVTDFRWQEEREDCPWYPSVRLFRQQRKEPWRDVLGRVSVALKTVLESHVADAPMNEGNDA